MRKKLIMKQQNGKLLNAFRVSVEDAVNKKWREEVEKILAQNKSDYEDAKTITNFDPAFFEGVEFGLDVLLERMEEPRTPNSD